MTREQLERLADHAHKLAFELECALLDNEKFFDEAHAALEAYRNDLETMHPSPLTHMGEPVFDKPWTPDDMAYRPGGLSMGAEQEPVAWMCADEDMTRKGYSRFSRNCEGEWNIPVYTAPPARKPLTDEQIDQIIASNVTITDRNLYGAIYMAIREVEQEHGIGEK